MNDQEQGRHGPDCEWHHEQYPWECTCGQTRSWSGTMQTLSAGEVINLAAQLELIGKKAERDALIAEHWHIVTTELIRLYDENERLRSDKETLASGWVSDTVTASDVPRYPYVIDSYADDPRPSEEIIRSERSDWKAHDHRDGARCKVCGCRGNGEG